jgi:cyclic pyranopterin phosphate synthase
MPKESFGPGHPFLADARLMTQPELVRIAGAFVGLGVSKVRLTGGEPLLRRDIAEIAGRLKSSLSICDLSLTTNGWFLEREAAALRKAGLERVNVSVDAIDEGIAGKMNGRGYSISRVLAGIDAAKSEGLLVKVNCVVQRGVNEGQILPLSEYFREKGHTLRFIEFMDVGTTNRWSMDQVVPARQIVDTISSVWPVQPVDPAYRGEVASRYRYLDGKGEIGIVSSVTEPFCRDCNRARLSADGRLFTCLFASTGTDILGPLRSGADDPQLSAIISRAWGSRSDRYSEERSEAPQDGARVEMSYIGG